MADTDTVADDDITYVEDHELIMIPTAIKPKTIRPYPIPPTTTERSINMISVLIHYLMDLLHHDNLQWVITKILYSLMAEQLTEDEFYYLQRCYQEICTQPVYIKGESNMHKWLLLTNEWVVPQHDVPPLYTLDLGFHTRVLEIASLPIPPPLQDYVDAGVSTVKLFDRAMIEEEENGDIDVMG